MQKFIKAANINNAMTDREIATRLTNAIVTIDNRYRKGKVVRGLAEDGH